MFVSKSTRAIETYFFAHIGRRFLALSVFFYYCILQHETGYSSNLGSSRVSPERKRATSKPRQKMTSGINLNLSPSFRRSGRGEGDHLWGRKSTNHHFAVAKLLPKISKLTVHCSALHTPPPRFWLWVATSLRFHAFHCSLTDTIHEPWTIHADRCFLRQNNFYECRLSSHYWQPCVRSTCACYSRSPLSSGGSFVKTLKCPYVRDRWS